MILNTIFHPTSSFEKSFFEPNGRKSMLVVALAGLFLSIAVFLLTTSVVYSIFAFAINIINWFVFSGVLFFFEFIHARKKSKKSDSGFLKSSSAVGTLWEINLFAYFILALGTWLIPIFSGLMFNIAVGLFFALLILSVIVWVIASFKMLKVVFGAQRGKLLLNWLILMILNGLIVTVINRLLASLIF